jgi:NTP pyrophosphatase (non-canonical NTP hydrolase)
MNNADLTIAEFQKHVSQRYEKVDRERGWAKTFAFFIEEVGELATALAAADKPDASEANQANLREEFADVIAWLCTLANVTDVKLAEAVVEKYLSEKKPQGHK